MQMYSLRLPSDEKSNLSKSLAAICSYGKPGQLLISAGTNKDSWNMFLAKLTCHMVSKGATEQDVYRRIKSNRGRKCQPSTAETRAVNAPVAQ
jgi:hypothetical protein